MIENIVIEISELSAEEESSVVLTRYLYNKNEVIVSLKMAMFDKNIEEAMFWGYELYFSGFEYDVFKVLSDMYELYYHAKHPNLGNYLNKMIIKWEDDQNENDNHWILGTIIKNMTLRSISLTYMLEERQGLSHLPSQIQEKTKNIFIQVKDDEIKQYYTINSLEFGRTYKFLRNVCKYTIRREAMDIFGTYYQDFNYHNVHNWLYFASFSPIWKLRIEKYGGVRDYQTQKICFNTDDKIEEFYDNYGYEPDEQSKEVQDKFMYIYKKDYVIGENLIDRETFSENSLKQLSWSEFCDKYGNESIFSEVVILSRRHTTKL